MNLLHIDSSPRNSNSVSRALSARLVDRMRAADPTVTIVRRDLGDEPLPHLGESAAAAIRGADGMDEDGRATLALSDGLIDELAHADVVVIGSPMYNFGMASQLKTWFDHVVRARKTFAYDSNGPKGLLGDKPVFVIESRGGVYSAGPMSLLDHQEGHIRDLLAFIGLTNVDFIRAEGLAMGEEYRERAIAGAAAEIDTLVGHDRDLAA